jgi:hypothetical protein
MIKFCFRHLLFYLAWWLLSLLMDLLVMPMLMLQSLWVDPSLSVLVLALSLEDHNLSVDQHLLEDLHLSVDLHLLEDPPLLEDQLLSVDLPLPQHLSLPLPLPQSLSEKNQLLLLPQLPLLSQLQLTGLPQLMLSLSQLIPQPTNSAMEFKEMPTPEVPSMPTTRTATDTTQLENTVLLFPMVAPRLFLTVLMMPTLVMLLMSGMRVLPSLTKPPRQLMPQHLHMLQVPKCLMLMIYLNIYILNKKTFSKICFFHFNVYNSLVKKFFCPQ